MEELSNHIIKEIKLKKGCGRNIHKYLMSKSFEYLKEKGFDVKIEYIFPNRKRIDIFGKKGEEKIGIECLVRPNLRIVEEKIKFYKKYCTKLLIAFPSDYIPKFPIDMMLQTLQFDLLGNSSRNNNIFVNDEVKIEFDKLQFDLKIKGYKKNQSELMKMLINSWKLNNTIQSKSTTTGVKK